MPAPSRISVFIPSHNRPESLARRRQAVAGLKHSRHGFEVIVVDDRNAASPYLVVLAFKDRLDIVYIKQAHRKWPTSRDSRGALGRMRRQPLAR
jgi:hypothetical protein